MLDMAFLSSYVRLHIFGEDSYYQCAIGIQFYHPQNQGLKINPFI